MTQTIAYTTLPDEALVDLLFTEEDRVPRAAADEVVRRGVSIAPRLVDILDDESLWNDEGPRWWAIVHAYFLLAHMQPPGALEVLLRALEQASRRHVDWITEEARYLLGAFGPRAVPTLKRAVVDETVHASSRVRILLALAWIGRTFAECRDETLTELRRVAQDRSAHADLRAFAGCELLDFALSEDRELILSTTDGWIFNEEDVRDVYSGKTPPRARLAGDGMRFYDPSEIERRQARWRDDEARRKEWEAKKKIPETLPVWEVAPGEVPVAPPADEAPPPLRAGPKVGRNDPCPCGTGKKFKKCCGR